MLREILAANCLALSRYPAVPCLRLRPPPSLCTDFSAHAGQVRVYMYMKNVSRIRTTYDGLLEVLDPRFMQESSHPRQQTRTLHLRNLFSLTCYYCWGFGPLPGVADMQSTSGCGTFRGLIFVDGKISVCLGGLLPPPAPGLERWP